MATFEQIKSLRPDLPDDIIRAGIAAYDEEQGIDPRITNANYSKQSSLPALADGVVTGVGGEGDGSPMKAVRFSDLADSLLSEDSSPKSSGKSFSFASLADDLLSGEDKPAAPPKKRGLLDRVGDSLGYNTGKDIKVPDSITRDASEELPEEPAKKRNIAMENSLMRGMNGTPGTKQTETISALPSVQKVSKPNLPFERQKESNRKWLDNSKTLVVDQLMRDNNLSAEDAEVEFGRMRTAGVVPKATETGLREATWSEAFDAGMAKVKPSFDKSMAGLASLKADATGDFELSNVADALRKTANDQLAEAEGVLAGTSKDSWKKTISDAPASLAQNLPTVIAASALASNPVLAGVIGNIGLAGMGMMSVGSSYSDGKDTGLNASNNMQQSVLKGLAEVIPEKMSLNVLVGALGKQAAEKAMKDSIVQSAKTLGKYMGSEIGTEELTTIAQFGVDKMYSKPDLSMKDLVGQMIDTAKATLIQTPILGGAGILSKAAVDNAGRIIDPVGYQLRDYANAVENTNFTPLQGAGQDTPESIAARNRAMAKWDAGFKQQAAQQKLATAPDVDTALEGFRESLDAGSAAAQIDQVDLLSKVNSAIGNSEEVSDAAITEQVATEATQANDAPIGIEQGAAPQVTQTFSDQPATTSVIQQQPTALTIPQDILDRVAKKTDKELVATAKLNTDPVIQQAVKVEQEKRANPIMKRADLVGAIMRVTGGNGIASGMAQTITGDKAGKALAKVRGLFTDAGTMDLGDVAMLLRMEENFDVRDGEHLAELIREQAAGNPVVSMDRMEAEAAANAEKEYKAEVNRRAEELGLKKVGGKRTLQMVEADIARVEQERSDMEAREERAAIQAEAAASEAFVDEGAPLTEDDFRAYFAQFASVEYTQEDIDRAEEYQANRENARIEAATIAAAEEQAQSRAGERNPDGETQAREGRTAEEGFNLTGETNEQAAANAARTEQDISKEQIDREAEYFGLSQQSQPKPQGVQGDLGIKFSKSSEAEREFAPVPEEKKSFVERLTSWFSLPQVAKKSGLPLTVGSTPAALIATGAKQLDVVIDKDTLIKLSRPHGNNPKGHGLTLEQISKIPDAIANPVAVFESAPDPVTKQRRNNGRVVLTEMVDSQGELITIVVHLGKESGRHVINDISSMYGRPDKSIENWVDSGLTLWFDDTRNETSPDWLTTNRLQLPYVVQAAQGLGNKLLLKSDFVKQQTTIRKSKSKIDKNRSMQQQIESPAFKIWSHNAPFISSEAATTHQFRTGEKVVVEAYHGTKRPDRVGTVFQQKRATSGPMAYSTSNPTLASSYSTAKSDTSLINEDNNYANWFKWVPPGSRSPVDIVRAWYFLDGETKAKIREMAPKIRADDMNNVVVEEGNESGNGSYDYNLEVSARRDYMRKGNPLEAMVEDWLNSGVLYNDEERFIEALRLAGFPTKELIYDSPVAEFPFVYKNFIAMQNPLVTSDVPQYVIDALKDAAKKDRSRPKYENGADMWDKNTRTLKEWVATYLDPNNENGAYVWTSIPDKVTDVFKSLGFDGIIDWSGKGGGEVHPVYIPFEESQMKSAIGNSGKYDPTKKDIMKSVGEESAEPKSTTAASRASLVTAFGEPVVRELEKKGLLHIGQSLADAIDKAAEMHVAKNGGDVDVVRKSLLSQAKKSISADGVSIEQSGRSPNSPLLVNGSADIVQLPPEITSRTGGRFLAKPVRLLNGKHFGKNRGYGVAHIEAEHGSEVGDVARYVVSVIRNATKIYDDGSGRLILQNVGAPRGIALVELRDEGEFYSVVTAFNGKERGRLVWSGRRLHLSTQGSGNTADAVTTTTEQSGSPSSGTAQSPINPKRPLETLEGQTSDQSITQPTLDVKRSSDGQIQGFYMPSVGASFLIADNVSAADMPAVALHEIGVHMASDSKDAKIAGQMAKLHKRAAFMLKAGKGNKFFDGVNQRLADAGETSPEEQAAYLVEAAKKARDSAPSSVKQWLKDLIAAVKGWLFRKGVLSANLMNENDILAVAESYLKEMAGVNGEGPTKYSKSLPNTIMVDGIERPTMNSNGKPIHPTQEGVRNFWRWFGDSKVVDAQGRPLVVYHGTASDFDTFSKNVEAKHIPLPGFYFTPETAYADRFAESAGKEFRDSDGYIAGTEGGNVMPVYLAIKSPMDIDAGAGVNRGMYPASVIKELLDDAQNGGNDGAIIRGWRDGSGPVQYVAFNPTQIKSATGNSGAFDGSNPDIRFSRASGQQRDNRVYSDESLITTKQARSVNDLNQKFVDDGFPDGMFKPLGMDDKGISSVFDKVFGSDVVYVEPANEEADGFLAMQWNGRIYVNPNNGRHGFINLLGHELLHELAKNHPGIYKYFADQARNYLTAGAVERYNERLQAAGADLERTDTYQEILADFVGDSLADPAFLKALADNNPGKFTMFVRTVTKWLKSVAAKMRGENLGSSEYFDDVRDLQGYLVGVLDAYSQVKSIPAPDNDLKARVSFSRAGNATQQTNAFTLPEWTKRDTAQERLQDRYNRIRDVVKAIRAQGLVNNLNDFDMGEDRFHGVAMSKIEDVQEELEALLRDAKDSGVSVDEAVLYAYAEHAPERNAAMQKINKNVQTGSGMSDQEALAIIDKAKQEGNDVALSRIAQSIRGIAERTLKLQLDSGLITQQEYDGYTNKYKKWVPLRGFETLDEDGSSYRGSGKGFNIRGKENLRALGRDSKAGQILENIIMDAERAIVRGTKNTEVNHRFLQFVMDNPDPTLWEIDATKTKQAMKNGRVSMEHLIDKGDNTIGVKVKGEVVYIKVKDQHLFEQLANQWNDDAFSAIPYLGELQKYFSKSYTAWSPEFALLTNPVRDFQAALFSITGREGVGMTGLFLKNYAKALKASYEAEVLGKKNLHYDLYKRLGGKTGFWNLSTLQSKHKEIQTLIKDMEAMNAKNAWRTPWKLIKALGRAVESHAGALENATRLASFLAMKEAGRSNEEAAAFAKNLNVNFNRRGSWASGIGSIFLFFNPAVQGTHNFYQTVAQGKHRKQVWAALGASMLGMMALAMMNAGAGDDDDGIPFWDKIPDYEKERNLIIVLPKYMKDIGEQIEDSTGRYFKIPMPYQWNVPMYAATLMVDSARNVDDKSQGISPAKAAINLALSLNSFNPISGLPPLLAPVKHHLTNTKPFGEGQLYPENDWNKHKPDSEKYSGAMKGSPWQEWAAFVNETTGGSQYEKGWISVPPAVWRDYVRSFVGGPMSFATSIIDSTAESDAAKAPFIRKVYNEVDAGEDMGKFHSISKPVETLKKSIKDANKANDTAIAKELEERNKALYDLGYAAEIAKDKLSANYKEDIRIKDSTTWTDKEKQLKLKINEKKRSDIQEEFLKKWRERMSKE